MKIKCKIFFILKNKSKNPFSVYKFKIAIRKFEQKNSIQLKLSLKPFVEYDFSKFS